jgi:maleate isomerase
MYRVGLLLPSSNVTMEPEFYRMAPPGVSVHSARMLLTEFTKEALSGTIKDAEREAVLLASAGVDVIVYGCYTCTLIGGVDWERVLTEQIEFNTGVRAITVNQAMIEAIRALKGRRVGVVTPYTKGLNQLKKRYLEANGFTVSDIRGLGLRDAAEIGAVSDEDILPLVEEVAGDADIILIGCTSIMVTHLIEGLEARLGVPVVTSTQAGLWAALKGSGIGLCRGMGA